MRALLDDPLLVRGQGGLVLTPMAMRLEPRIAVATSELKRVFEEPRFDPAVERRTLRIAASDAQTVLLAPGIMARLQREAPGIDIRMVPYRADMQMRMERGALDFAFAISTSELPAGARSEPIANDQLALVMRSGHPAAGKTWTIEDYACFDHVGIAILGDEQSELDAQLAAAGVSRRMALVTPHFTAALAAVAATDMVTTVSETFARRFAKAYHLVLKKPPLSQTDLTMTLVWSHIHATDPLLIWFRGVVRDAAVEVFGKTGAPT